MRPKVVRVYSENNAYQHVEALRRNRAKRQKAGEFLVEGVRSINQMLAAGWQVNAFLYAREQRLSDWASGILERSEAPTHFELPAHLVAKLSGKEEASELLAVAAIPEDRLDRIAVRPDLLVVVFDRPASPGNLGTLIRSCDALGAHGLIVTGHAADVYAPEAVSASVGSLFSLPVVRLPSQAQLVPWLEGVDRALGGVRVVGSSAGAERDVDMSDLAGPTVLLVGNETWGLSAGYRAMCDELVRIPMGGSASSLNVACAATVLLYEADRQRRAKGTGAGQTTRAAVGSAANESGAGRHG